MLCSEFSIEKMEPPRSRCQEKKNKGEVTVKMNKNKAKLTSARRV